MIRDKTKLPNDKTAAPTDLANAEPPGDASINASISKTAMPVIARIMRIKDIITPNAISSITPVISEAPVCPFTTMNNVKSTRNIASPIDIPAKVFVFCHRASAAEPEAPFA